MSTAKEIALAVAMGCLLLAVVCGSLIFEQAINNDYRIEALKVTADCEACQLIILTKGH